MDEQFIVTAMPSPGDPTPHETIVRRVPRRVGCSTERAYDYITMPRLKILEPKAIEHAVSR